MKKIIIPPAEEVLERSLGEQHVREDYSKRLNELQAMAQVGIQHLNRHINSILFRHGDCHLTYGMLADFFPDILYIRRICKNIIYGLGQGYAFENTFGVNDLNPLGYFDTGSKGRIIRNVVWNDNAKCIIGKGIKEMLSRYKEAGYRISIGNTILISAREENAA